VNKTRQLWQRLLGRLRYGLLIQEMLDRLARAQVFIYPYFVVLEPAGTEPPAAADARCSFRLLRAADVDEVTRVLVGRITEEVFLELLTRTECLGVFYDGKLAGYTWVRLDMVAVPEGLGQPVFVLHPDEAYLFDMYVASPYRGLQLAGILRQSMQSELKRRGRTRFYSLTLAFNRSSQRFKARLGAQQLELRILLHLRIASLPGCDLRLWRRRPHLRSVWARRIPAAAKAAVRG
jgi:GNAT superfamily N-acetyltransferase